MKIIKPVGLTLLNASESENDAAEWDSSVVYPFGVSVIRAGSVYVTSIEGNVGLDPLNEVQELEGARWILKGVTNIRRFLDGRLATKTEGVSPLVLEVRAAEQFNAAALFGIVGTRVTVEVNHGSGWVFARSILSGPEPVGSWFDWLHSTFSRSTRRAVVPEVSGFAGSRLRITIEGPSPSLGLLVVGRRVAVGVTRFVPATKVRRRTFTDIETDKFGVSEATKRVVARNVTYSVVAARDGFSAIERFLDDVDGVQVVSYAHEAAPEFTNFGFILDYEIPAELPEHFVIEFTVQGVS